MNPTSKPWSKRWPEASFNTALTAVAAALIGLAPPTAQALSLGPIVVQSALGEPLRAEIDVLEINAEEAASLRTTVASPEAFRAAGLDYNAAIANLRVTLQRRANGRSFIRLQSDRPVNDPFVDMILEANWSSGRIVRDYTMLFDPPNLRAAPAAVAQATAPAVQEAVATPAAPAARAPAAVAPRAAPAPRAPAAVAAAKTDKPATAGEGQVVVKPGDTASKIALASKPASVSLDQMLVALLRANPDAFINGNLNRIKSGAVVTIPTGEQATALGPKEATQTVIAQSRDFGDFRKKLAGAAPTAQVAAADRQSSGSVQTKVDDKKTGAATPDKLTLSKGAVAAQSNADKVAQELAAKDAAAKSAAVSKNIAELSKLGAASAPAAPGATGTKADTSTPATGAGTTPGATAGVSAVPAPVVVAAPAAAGASAPAPSPAPMPATAASMPAKPVVKVAAPAESSLIDQLTENPLIPAAGVGLLALLAGFGLYRARERKKAQDLDSAFLESRLQPDSFFGGSGGQRVDTQDSQAGGSSMVYTPSQLDAADDVDPVAEADVYLAYGRDVQAEEILKEALKSNSGRIAIHQKLLEIYAKRRDTRNFEITSNQAFKVTNGTGADWTRICDLGLSIDPANPLYMPGGEPSVAVGIASQPASLDMINEANAANASPASRGGMGTSTVPLVAAASVGMATVALAGNSFNATTTSMNAQPSASGGAVDLDFDLDLDFSLDDDNAKVISDLSGSEQTASLKAMDSGPVPLDMDFDAPTSPSTVSSPMAPATRSSPLEFSLPGVTGLSNSGEVSRPAPLMPTPDANDDMSLEFEPSPIETDEFKHQAAVSFGTTIAGPLALPKAPEAPTPVPELMAFDLGSLSLDLGDAKPALYDPNQTAPITAATPLEDPLATKLSLAEEFSSIGDADGARALIEEVLLEATGDVKTKAQAALAKLS